MIHTVNGLANYHALLMVKMNLQNVLLSDLFPCRSFGTTCFTANKLFSVAPSDTLCFLNLIQRNLRQQPLSRPYGLRCSFHTIQM